MGEQFWPGDAARIARGVLAELTGISVRTSAHQACIITLDDAKRFSVILPATSLEIFNQPPAQVCGLFKGRAGLSGWRQDVPDRAAGL
jgi:hypothetical protein